MIQRLRPYLPDLWITLGLLLLPLILFAPVTLGSRTLLPADNLLAFEPWRSAAAQFGVAGAPVPHNKLLDDLVLENYPWKKFILESLHAGQLPLWNPYQFAGLPFLAAGQSSALYPFSIIFYVAPLARAFGLFTVSQFFLAGLFAYLFLRVLGLRRLSAAFGAIVYELSLFMVVSVVFPMIVASAAWLPLILTAIELAVRRQPALGGRPATLPWLALGSAAIGLQILAGHVEITYYTLIVAGAYSAWRLGSEFLQRRADGQAAAARRLAGQSLALVALAGFGLALGAVQLIPLFEVVQHNFRSGSATFDQIIGWAYPWRHALAFLVPNIFGNPSHHGYFDLFTWHWTPATLNAQGAPIDNIFWGIKNYVEGGAYVGLLPLLLTPIAFVAWVRQLRRGQPGGARPLPLGFFFVLAFLSLSFAFQTRLYALIFWLPGINQLHSPFRWVWPLSLCIAVLSAAGLDKLRLPRELVKPALARPRNLAAISRAFCLWSQPSLVTAIAGLAVWGGALALVGLLVARAGYDSLGVGRLMDQLLLRLALADQAFANGRMFFSYEAPWLLAFAALLVASGLVLRASTSSMAWRGRPAWHYLALGVLVVDLSAAGWGFNPSADPRLLTYVPPSVGFLRQDTSLWRFTTYDTRGAKPFYANQGWYFDFYDVRGYDSIFTQQYKRYMELIQPQNELDFNRIAPISDPVALDSPLLDLLNVKYVISLEQIDSPKYQLVYSAEVKIYQNATALPRAFLLPQSATLVTPDFGQAVQSYDPRKYVIVEQPGAPAPSVVPTGVWPTAVDDIQYSPNEVSVAATAAEPSWLVLADSYFPGWKAYLRPAGASLDQEKSLSIQLVDGNFRGARLPAGSWIVRFRYSPNSFKLGGIISLTAAVALLFGLGVYAWRYFYQESALDSTARRVAKNSLAPLALNLVSRAIDFAFAAFMLRVLGPDDAGKYYYAVVIFGWFEIITNYGLNALLIRDVARDREHADRYLVNTTLLRLALGLVAIPALAALLLLRQVLPPVVLPFGLGAFQPERLAPETLWAIALLVLAAAPGTVATGLSALFTAYEKAEYPAAVVTLTTLIKVALGTIVLVLGWGFVGLAGTSIVVNVITLAVLGVLAWRLFWRPLSRLRFEFDPAFQRHAVRESFPLMLNNLLATLFFKVDVTLLEPIQGPTQVGWYSAGYKFIDGFNLAPSLFTFALFPVMSRQAREDVPALGRSYTLAIKLLFAAALPLALVVTAAAPLMIGLLGGSAYLPYGALALAILVWSIPFGWINSVTNYVLIALGQQRGLTRAFAASLAFNIVLNLLFLPRFGFQAAAVITIVSELFEGALFYIYLRRSLGAQPWPLALWRLGVSGAAMLAVAAALWRINPFLAAAAGLAAYALGLVVLRPFTPDEQTILMGILPSRFRRIPWLRRAAH